MWVWVNDMEDVPAPVRIHRITDTWTESGVNWSNTSGDFDAAVEDTVVPAFQGPLSADLTTLVQAWVNGTHANDGVMLIPTSIADEAKWVSRDGLGRRRATLLQVTSCRRCSRICRSPRPTASPRRPPAPT